MPDLVAGSGTRASRFGALALASVVGVLLAIRGASLLFDHSLHSIDGAMQTWFALDNFAAGNQLGSEFQSYLGVTMPIALLPIFMAAGGTLFASTLSAYLAVLLGAFATAYAIVWMLKTVCPDQRWMIAIGLVFVFYFFGAAIAQAIGLSYPLSLDPGVSLRPVRSLLPVLVLPVFVWALRLAFEQSTLVPAIALGTIVGFGSLWSNDSGIPLLIATVAALVLALHRQPALLVRWLGVFGLSTIVSAAVVVMAVTQGVPEPWLQYNFRDVAGDQIWYFAPWDRSTRILAWTDIPQIVLGGNLLSTLSLVLLCASVFAAAVKSVLAKGDLIREPAFVMVGASVIGTALIPQIGGHIDGLYNDMTFMLGVCGPLIIMRDRVGGLINRLRRSVPVQAPLIATGLATLLMVGAEGARAAQTISSSDRSVYDQDLGFFVTESFAQDLAAMRDLSEHWDSQQIPQDRRILSVYTSALDVSAGTVSPAPVGSLIHALGNTNRAAYTDLVANSKVQAVTTIEPNYSGWEGWMRRANWPFFQALRENYQPVARTDQHVLWLPRTDRLGVAVDAECEVASRAGHVLDLRVSSPRSGWASISVDRLGPVGAGRNAILTVTESSPWVSAVDREPWSDFPRYGAPNQMHLSLVAPVVADQATTLRLEMLDQSSVGSARCEATILEAIEFASLPGFAGTIEAHLQGGGQ